MALLPESASVSVNREIPEHVSDHRQIHEKLNAVIDVVADFGATGDGSTDDTTAIVNALAEADSLGTDHSSNWSSNAPGQTYTVYFPPGIYMTDSISLDDLNVNIWAAGPASTRFRANSGIGGYVMDMRGWKGHLAQSRGSNPFGNFSIEGTHAADATLAEGGLIMGMGTLNTQGPGGYNLRNISIFGTGGPAFKMMPGCHLGRITDLTLQRPVSADTNDVPYLHVFGDSNGVLWDRLALRSVTGDPDGTKVALWEFDSASGTAQDVPAYHHIRVPWVENPTTPSGGAVFWLETVRSVLDGVQLFDQSAEATPASPTSVVRLSGDNNSGVNEIRGYLPGDGADAATTYTYGLYVETDGNYYGGVSGYKNDKVYLASGVDYNTVILGGQESIVASSPFDDDSGTTTNTLIDYSSKTFIPESSAYSPSNVTPDRSFDANSTSVEELADVVGTLIADLQAGRHIG